MNWLEKISKEKKMDKKTIALDFDGVIHDYRKWDGPVPSREPISGAKEFIEGLIEDGYEVVINGT